MLMKAGENKTIPANYFCHFELNITKEEFYHFYVWRKTSNSYFGNDYSNNQIIEFEFNQLQMMGNSLFYQTNYITNDQLMQQSQRGGDQSITKILFRNKDRIMMHIYVKNINPQTESTFEIRISHSNNPYDTENSAVLDQGAVLMVLLCLLMCITFLFRVCCGIFRRCYVDRKALRTNISLMKKKKMEVYASVDKMVYDQ